MSERTKCVSCDGAGFRYVRRETGCTSGATQTCADCGGTGYATESTSKVPDAVARQRVKLWFFRELTDEQRTALLALLFYPEIKRGVSLTTWEQERFLDRAFDTLRGTT